MGSRERASCFCLMKFTDSTFFPYRDPWPQNPHSLLFYCRTRETGEAGTGLAPGAQHVRPTGLGKPQGVGSGEARGFSWGSAPQLLG